MAIKRKTHLNLSGSHHTLDSDNAFIGGFAYITGSLTASQGITSSAIYSSGLVSGSQGIFSQLTGSLSGTLAGLPFLVNGGNMAGVNYNSSTGQWELTGSSGTSVAGSNTQIQFNADGVHGASSLLTFNTASVNGLAADTLSAPTGSFEFLSGSNANTILNSFGTAKALVVNSDVVLTRSLMAFDGVNADIGVGGLLLQNGAEFTVASGSYTGNNEIFKILPAGTPDKAEVRALAETFKINGFDIVPLWNHATTSLLAPNTNLSGSLLSDFMPPSGVGVFDLNVIAADTNQANYAAWRTIVTMTSSNAGGINVAGITEIDNILVGSDAAGWDVNINVDEIEVTGSLTLGGSVYWMAKLTQKMILSSSGQVLY